MGGRAGRPPEREGPLETRPSALGPPTLPHEQLGGTQPSVGLLRSKRQSLHQLSPDARGGPRHIESRPVPRRLLLRIEAEEPARGPVKTMETMQSETNRSGSRTTVHFLPPREKLVTSSSARSGSTPSKLRAELASAGRVLAGPLGPGRPRARGRHHHVPRVRLPGPASSGCAAPPDESIQKRCVVNSSMRSSSTRKASSQRPA